MLNINNIPWKQRILELFVDYICILIYLLLLFSVNMGIYLGILGQVPSFGELQAHLIAIFASVLPIIIIFSVLDYRKGSIGKRKAKLRVHYKNKSFKASLLRNTIKFLPWQLAHIGVIHGMYSDFDLVSIIFASAGMGLSLAMLIMGLARNDKRHLGDLLAGTQVQTR